MDSPPRQVVYDKLPDSPVRDVTYDDGISGREVYPCTPRRKTRVETSRKRLRKNYQLHSENASDPGPGHVGTRAGDRKSEVMLPGPEGLATGALTGQDLEQAYTWEPGFEPLTVKPVQEVDIAYACFVEAVLSDECSIYQLSQNLFVVNGWNATRHESNVCISI